MHNDSFPAEPKPVETLKSGHFHVIHALNMVKSEKIISERQKTKLDHTKHTCTVIISYWDAIGIVCVQRTFTGTRSHGNVEKSRLPHDCLAKMIKSQVNVHRGMKKKKKKKTSHLRCIMGPT
jgi:hypothetical protein